MLIIQFKRILKIVQIFTIIYSFPFDNFTIKITIFTIMQNSDKMNSIAFGYFFYLLIFIASMGHASAHNPHWVHFSWLYFISSFFMSRARGRHASMHWPHFIHSMVSITTSYVFFFFLPASSRFARSLPMLPNTSAIFLLT